MPIRFALPTLALAALVALAGNACRPAAQEVSDEPRRSSFEEDSWGGESYDDDAWDDEGSDDVEARADAISSDWKELRDSDASADEKARQAGELLRRTQELADDTPDAAPPDDD
ncbi:MAG TPA: hypothetical protein VMT16_10185 [Thermoanaerobaculia bacterium]|nr:hypothetical protein [Thermoanaerobaculia bacterium]